MKELLREHLKGINVYLIGMMGAGKSTVGQRVADRLGYRFFDTDAVVEQLTQTLIPTLFATVGEEGFRQVESQVLAELSAYTRLVVATGGGIVLDPMNWSHLRDGVVVWLNAPVALLEARLQTDTSRPLLQDADLSTRLETLLSQRRSLYAQADAQVEITPDASPEQVADLVLEQILAVLKAVDAPV